MVYELRTGELANRIRYEVWVMGTKTDEQVGPGCQFQKKQKQIEYGRVERTRGQAGEQDFCLYGVGSAHGRELLKPDWRKRCG